jgi:DNA-binding SARP family transcriptional activator/tetratricopeptide (TPR) repeat protein
MVTLRLLGSVALEGDEGPVAGRSAQRRRLAILALLSTAPRQTLSRDRIIGFLWPDADEDRARRLLSESLYVLRKALGEDAVLTPGDDLRLNPEVIRCDVAAFREAVDRGEFLVAVEVYRGPFLEGFFLSDAPDFEHWADGERARLSRSFGESLRVLAERATEEENVSDAVKWWGRLAGLDPYNAEVATAYMLALDAAGDRAAALQHARIHETLWKEDFGGEPDPAVAALAERLREAPLQPLRRLVTAQPSPAEPEPAPADGPSEVPRKAGLSEGGHPEATGGSEGSRPSPGFLGFQKGIPLKPVLLGLPTVAAVVALLLMFPRRASEPIPTPPSPGRDAVAVLPFSVRGEPEFSYLREGMVSLLSTALDGAGNLRSVDRYALLASLGGEWDGREISPEAARRVSRSFGARYFLLGDVVVGGGRLRLSASLYEPGAGPEATPIEVVEGDPEELFRIVDEMAARLLSQMQAGSGRRLSRIAALTTQSLPALKAYLEGETEFRATRYDLAYEAFQRAVEADPTFALAQYRLSASAMFDLRFAEARLAAQRARRNADRLSAHDAALLLAWDDLINGSAESAGRQYESILRDYPDDVEALFGLGEAQVYFNPMRGQSAEQAREAFERVLSLTPDFGEARFHLLELAASRGDSGAFNALHTGVDPRSEQALAWDAVGAYAWGTPTEKERIETRIRRSEPMAGGIAVARVAAHVQDFPAAERLGSLLGEAGRTEDWRDASRALVAEMRFAQGRLREGMEALKEVEGSEEAWALEFQALFTGFPYHDPDPGAVDDLRSRLLDWQAESAPSSFNFIFSAHNGFHRFLRPYLLGLLSVWAGNPEEARGFAREVERAARTPETAARAFAWAESIRGHLAWASGQNGQAIDILGEIRLDAPLELVVLSPFFSRSYDRFVLGRALRESGRDDEDLAWFSTLTGGYEVVFVAPAHLEMGRILLHLGRAEEARTHFARFLSLWEHADPEFHPLLDEARAVLDVGS